MRISDWSSDVCSSDLLLIVRDIATLEGPSGPSFFARYTPPMPDHAPDNAHRQAAWSRYWKQDVLHSLPGSFSGNYAGRIERFWLDSFAALGSGQRMLDIATGNGPIPQLACTPCAGRAAGMPRIDAIDLAQVAPAWVSRSEEQTSELQPLMPSSSAAFCLKKKN